MLSPRSLRQEHAALLLRKAAQDERIADLALAAPDIDDESIGFHLQQAAEKLLKAVLAAHGAVYARTHDLGELVRVLPTQVGFPAPVSELIELTSFAVLFRYSELPPGQVSLDRPAARDLIRRLRVWAEARIASTP